MQGAPALNGNWVDLLILLAFVFYLWQGIKRGFIVNLLDLLSFILSFFIALKFYTTASWLLRANFNLPRGFAKALGFLSVGFTAEFIFSLVIHKILSYIPFSWQKSSLEKTLGILPAVGNVVVVTAFLLTLLISLPIKGAVKSAILSSKFGAPLIAKTAGVENQLAEIFGGAVEESLSFLTVETTSQESLDLNFTQKQVNADLKAEREMFLLINKERKKRNLPLLTSDVKKLRELARDHAQDMFERGYFSHYTPEQASPFDRMDKRNIRYTSAGENLALAPNVSMAHQGLMNSPGHRANILSPDFKKVGIGVLDGGIYGKMFVQEFTD